MSPAPQRGEYSTEWEAIASRVKDDAGRRCVRCGHPHDPKAGRTLTVHHFDGDRSNNRRWNLMALCQACHLSVQSRVDPKQGLLTRPALWILPYIAGMVEDGCTPSPPGYGRAWVESYVSQLGVPWPNWAPTPGMGPLPGPACRICGCTDLWACVVGGRPCSWVGPNLCSVCLPYLL